MVYLRIGGNQKWHLLGGLGLPPVMDTAFGISSARLPQHWGYVLAADDNLEGKEPRWITGHQQNSAYESLEM